MRANKLLLLGSSLATLMLLVLAAYRESFDRDWRRLQAAYRARLEPEAAAGFDLHLRQLYVPALRATDRCISCHVGMAPGETGIVGDPVFSPHPAVGHDPADFGCVVCHDGQGRATEKADAHGTVPFWPHPMLAKRHAQAGCGSCHTHVAIPSLEELTRGDDMVARYDCLSCHTLDGRGGTLRPGTTIVTAPSLNDTGARASDAEWYTSHLERHRTAREGLWQTAFGPIPDSDRRAIDRHLASRVGAPALVRAKATFHSLGCRGCHKIGGIGGDDGPDLTRAGERDPALTDFASVPGEHTVAAWFAEHLRAPAAVVPGSRMPALGLDEPTIELLTLYTLSLRRSDQPEAYWPIDRVRAERLGAREFATDGATLYGTFCAACHGPAGEGMRYPGMPAFPAIGNADFLAIASDRFLVETITRGRPGRRMPAWSEKSGGLRANEIAAIVGHLRTFAPDAPVPVETAPATPVRGDARRGGRLYADACATCHGAAGEGAEGPALANPVLQATATDTYLFETIRRGRGGTSMPAFGAAAPTHRLLEHDEIADVVAYVRTWAPPGKETTP